VRAAVGDGLLIEAQFGHPGFFQRVQAPVQLAAGGIARPAPLTEDEGALGLGDVLRGFKHALPHGVVVVLRGLDDALHVL